MGKSSLGRRVADNEALAIGRLIRTSPRKLNVVAGLIRRRPAEVALTELQFSPRRVAREARKVVLAAIANAENNHGLDVDRLVIAEASVGKSVKMRRFRPRARGRAGSIEKFYSRLTVIVAEQSEDDDGEGGGES